MMKKNWVILVISYVFLVNIKNGFFFLFFVVFNKCLSNAHHNEICQYCKNQIMGLFFFFFNGSLVIWILRVTFEEVSCQDVTLLNNSLWSTRVKRNYRWCYHDRYDYGLCMFSLNGSSCSWMTERDKVAVRLCEFSGLLWYWAELFVNLYISFLFV